MTNNMNGMNANQLHKLLDIAGLTEIQYEYINYLLSGGSVEQYAKIHDKTLKQAKAFEAEIFTKIRKAANRK
jgi:hypothetical protein